MGCGAVSRYVVLVRKNALHINEYSIFHKRALQHLRRRHSSQAQRMKQEHDWTRTGLNRNDCAWPKLFASEVHYTAPA